jgi:hypothetical protein
MSRATRKRLSLPAPVTALLKLPRPLLNSPSAPLCLSVIGAPSLMTDV